MIRKYGNASGFKAAGILNLKPACPDFFFMILWKFQRFLAAGILIMKREFLRVSLLIHAHLFGNTTLIFCLQSELAPEIAIAAKGNSP